ncbi:unnamed protein product [Meloidogyne enterolobii]|uniref:Uncharacterized protein n=1 Tax=Meloidogyne enterolobii TaxID=390850 RepID=A0ACB0ZGJ6_MELEN
MILNEFLWVHFLVVQLRYVQRLLDLLNPNCKYEANYIPLFTLSDWIQSDSDAPHVEKDQDAVLETAPSVEDAVVRVVEESTQRTKKRLYHPLNSLRLQFTVGYLILEVDLVQLFLHFLKENQSKQLLPLLLQIKCTLRKRFHRRL